MVPVVSLAQIRKLAGWSRDRAAVEARCAYQTARLYEIDPEAVSDAEARARLDAVYVRIREIADARKGAAA
jgi:hypothetical protein